MSGALLLAALLACLLALAFFAGSELAFVSADRAALRAQAEAGRQGARLALRALERPAWLLGTCLLGGRLASLAGASLAAVLAVRHLGQPAWTAALIFAPTSVILGHLVPRTLFQLHATRLLPLLVRPLHLVGLALTPLLWMADQVSRGLAAPGGKPRLLVHEELRLLLETGAQTGGSIRAEEQALIRRVFQFTESVVEDAMVPLIEVVAVPTGTPVAQVARKMAISGHSRLPVYRDRVDRIVGLVLHQDVLAATDWSAPIQDLMRPVSFVPESKPVDELLLEMRRRRAHMAIAVDEYGGAVGIITIEDLLEEIVGDIEDESDKGQDMVRRTGEREWIARGRAEHQQLEQACGLRLPDGDYETVAGFLLSELGRVPRAGEHMSVGDFVLTIGKASDRAIQEVILRRRR